MRRLVALSIGVLALAALPSDARAGDFALSVGTELGAVDIVGARGVTDVGTRIGYRTGHLHLFGTVDFARYTTRTEFESEDFTPVGSRGSLLTAGAGARYLFQEPESDRTSPYVVGNGFTVVPNFDREEQAPEQLQGASSFGFLGGFGVDHYFTEAFSVGGEVGLQGMFASRTDATSTWRGSLIQVYTSLQLSFYL